MKSWAEFSLNFEVMRLRNRAFSFLRNISFTLPPSPFYLPNSDGMKLSLDLGVSIPSTYSSNSRFLRRLSSKAFLVSRKLARIPVEWFWDNGVDEIYITNIRQ